MSVGLSNIADTGTSMSGISNALISPSIRETCNNLLCVTSGKMAKESLNGSVKKNEKQITITFRTVP